jgi:FkbM family methyltransferase
LSALRKLLSFAPQGFKDALRQQMAKVLGVAYPRHGLPGELVSSIGSNRALSVVDVGAHAGAFSAGIEQLCGMRRAILCEPNPEKAASLRRRFSGTNYEIFQGAICAHDGEAEFHVASFDAISSLMPILGSSPDLGALDTSTKATIKVEARTLDSLLGGIDFGPVDLLKIDVQGAELLVLHGARKVLAQTARIWVEVSLKPLYEGSALFPEVYQFLVDRGFGLQAVDPGYRSPNGELLQLDLLFLPFDRAGRWPC